MNTSFKFNTVGLAIGEAPRETVNGKGSTPPPAPPLPTASELAQPQQGQGGEEKDSKSARKQLPDRAIYQPPAPAPRSAAEGETTASGSLFCHLYSHVLCMCVDISDLQGEISASGRLFCHLYSHILCMCVDISVLTTMLVSWTCTL